MERVTATPALALLVEAAKKGGLERRLDEFGRDPVLTVACVLLVVVSIGWFVAMRGISHRLRRAAERGQLRVDEVQPPRDIWKAPP